MKYKHVFMVWLLADVILATVAISYFFLGIVIWGKHFFKQVFAFLGNGILFSLPSLLLLSILYPFLTTHAFKNKDTYIFAIVGINFSYFVVSALLFGFDESGIVFLFYCGTTIAGLIALFLVKKFIQPKTTIELNKEL